MGISHLHSPLPPTFLLLVFFCVLLVFHSFLFPLSFAVYMHCRLFAYLFSCTNTACLSTSRTLSPTLTLLHPCSHRGLSIRHEYLYALTSHNRRSPTDCDGHAGFCVRSCDWIKCIQYIYFAPALASSCRPQVTCLKDCQPKSKRQQEHNFRLW